LAGAAAAGVEGAVVAGKLLEKSDEESLQGRLGYNAATDKFEDLVAAGVIDPVKVGTLTGTRDALCILLKHTGVAAS
jgi:chaperonin GroEL